MRTENRETRKEELSIAKEEKYGVTINITIEDTLNFCLGTESVYVVLTAKFVKFLRYV